MIRPGGIWIKMLVHVAVIFALAVIMSAILFRLYWEYGTLGNGANPVQYWPVRSGMAVYESKFLQPLSLCKWVDFDGKGRYIACWNDVVARYPNLAEDAEYFGDRAFGWGFGFTLVSVVVLYLRSRKKAMKWRVR